MAVDRVNVKRADVCIVGCGPAGLTVARRLVANNRHVLLLDSGPPNGSREAQLLNDGDHVGIPYAGLMRTRHRRVGGTPNIWDVVVRGRPGAKYLPLSERDVRDWPMDSSELRQWYTEAQAICSLGPFDYDAASWSSANRQPFELSGTGLTNGVYHFGYADRFTVELVEELRSSGLAELHSSRTVVGLVYDQSGRELTAVKTVDGEGRRGSVEARHFVLATGAVENARLLLMSGIGGTTHVGKGFMEHARDFSPVLVPFSPELFERAGFYDLFEAGDGHLVGGRLGFDDKLLDAEDLPNAAVTLVAQHSQSHLRRRIAGRLPGRVRRWLGFDGQRRYGWSDVESPARRFDVFGLIVNIEQRPRPENCVLLDHHRNDAYGNPLPRLFLDWTDAEQAELDRLRRLLAESFERARIGQLLTRKGQPPNLSAHHHAGTTRMSATPEAGVVDPDGRVFGLDNLFMAGASVFPSAGFANPCLTIVALSARLGDHLDRLL